MHLFVRHMSIDAICPTPQDAASIRQTLATRCNDRIEISGVKLTMSQVKITGILMGVTYDAEFVEIIKRDNHWLLEQQLSVSRSYEITTNRGTYRNYIIETDLAAQKLFLDHKQIIVGFKECNVYEYVNLLQWFNCYRFGHFQTECKFSSVCKKCGYGHKSAHCLQTNATPR